MAKPVNIPNSFATSTSAIPLSYLDQDFNALANSTNDLATYSNYVADTGAANAYIANFPTNTNTSSLTAGLRVQFKAANANTGTSTLNVQVNSVSIGSGTIKLTDGSNLPANAIIAGALVDVMYDGTNFQLLSDSSGGAEVITNLTLTGNLAFTGTGNRILGDFSNATVNNRVAIQSSTTDGSTQISIIPNGTATISGFQYRNSSDASNYSQFLTRITGTEAQLSSTITGTGSYVPMTFLTGGSERMRIDTSGNVSQATGSYFLGNGGGFGWGDLSTYIGGTSATDFINFVTNSAERMRIDSSGNVGIGTTSPACTLALNGTGATGGQIQFQRNGTLQGNIYGTSSAFRIENTSSTPIVFLQNTGTEYMRITSAGDVGIGTTSPAARLETNVASGNNEFRMTIAGTASAQFISTTTDFTFVNLKTGAQVFFNNGAERMRIDSSGNVGIGTSSPGVKLDVNGQRIKIQNASDPGIEFHNASTIKGYVFYDTTNDLMTMRHNSTSTGVSVNSSGNVLVGTTASNGKLSTETASATQRTIHAASNGGSATTDGVYYGYVNQARGTGFNFMAFQNTSAVDFKVLGNGNVQNTNNSYGAISDVKLKENIVDATPKLDDLMKVKVRHYNFIDDESKTKQIGVIAQEIEQVFSGIVENILDRDEEGNILNTVTKSVKYSVFVPMLIKAIQEQQTIINDLKARIETLETK